MQAPYINGVLGLIGSLLYLFDQVFAFLFVSIFECPPRNGFFFLGPTFFNHSRYEFLLERNEQGHRRALFARPVERNVRAPLRAGHTLVVDMKGRARH